MKTLLERIYEASFILALTAMLIFMPAARGSVRILPFTVFASLVLFLFFFRLIVKLNSPAGVSLGFKRTILDKPIACFVGIAAISVSFSVYKYGSITAFCGLLVYTVFYYLVSDIYTRELRRIIVYIIIAAGTIFSLIGILQYVGILSNSWWSNPRFLSSVYVNHNHFSGFLEMAIPLALGLFIWFKPNKQIFQRGIIFISLVLMSAVMLLAQSRAGWVSLGIALLFMITRILARKGLGRRRAFLIFLFISAVLFLVFQKRDVILDRAHSISAISSDTDVSWQARVKIWQGTIGMIKERPFTGAGIGCYDNAFYEKRPEKLYVLAQFAHNDYLHMAAEMGVLGAVIMLWIIFVVIATGVSLHYHPVILGATSGIIALCIHGLIDFNFHIPANMVLFILLAVFVIQEKKLEIQERERR